MEETDSMKPMSDEEIDRLWDTQFEGEPERAPLGDAPNAEPESLPDGAEAGERGDVDSPREGDSDRRDEGATAPEERPGDDVAQLKAEILRLKSEAGRVKPLAKRNRELKAELERLRSQMADAAVLDVAQEGANAPSRAFSDEERATLGDEAADTLQGRFGDVDALLREQGKRLEELTAREHALRREEMNDTVEGVYGKAVWALQDDPKFKAWLEERNPLAGQKNGHLLNAFGDSFNAEGMIALIDAYARRTGWRDGAYPPPPPSSSGPRTLGGTPNARVMPSGSRAATTPYGAPPRRAQKRVYAQREVEAFYRKADANPSWAQSKEGVSIFEDINDAMYEGRISP